MSVHTDLGERSRGTARLASTLRERWWVVLAGMVLLGGVALALSLFVLTPRYGATAQVAYSQTDADAVSKVLTDAGAAALPKTLASDALVLKTSAFADRVSKAMSGSLSPEILRSSVSASTLKGVEMIEIRGVASQADLAAGIANASADEFIKTRQEELRRLLQSALEFVQGRIDSLAPGEQGVSASALEQQRYALTSLMSRSLADYKVLERAAVPASPEYPRPWIDLLWGMAAGLILGLLLVMLMSSTDRRIRDRATLERVMGLPVVGAMPAAAPKRGGKRGAVGFRKGDESLLESMRVLHSNLKLLGFGETKRTILVTSTGPGESKSALAVNLALSMALAGDRVILVDADLRSPAIDRYLGIPNAEGLGDALADSDIGWSDRIQVVDLVPFVDPRFMNSRATGAERGVSKFLCLTGGTLPVDPTEALRSAALRMLLADLRGYSDYVIVNGPPMVAASDSLILAKSVDAVILATSLGKQTISETRRLRQLLDRAELQALGMVICGGKPQNPDSYHVYVHRDQSDFDLID